MSLDRYYDLLVIGGGINGVGIARDAAGRGLKVLLCEKGDLASATSSASTKLIHGGLRYLETFDFRLVREALIEREIVLRLAPHIVRPMRFVLPHDQHMRPAWMIRLGLFLYDRLGGRKLLRKSKFTRLRRDRRGAPLKPAFKTGFVYSDCWVDDARLVVLNAVDAAERGATIMTRCKCVKTVRAGAVWRATLEPDDGPRHIVEARAIVNATGPWAASCLEDVFGQARHTELRLVKGSHFTVPRLFDGDHAFILQNPDGRVVFAIPYEDEYTLIGTTEVDYAGDPGAVRITDGEIEYLCTSINRYFAAPVRPSDVLWSFAGVRPLQDEDEASASKVTRDYELVVSGQPPVLTVVGGKITTYRKLAEHALEKLEPYFKDRLGEDWTARAPLPGGDIDNADFDSFKKSLAAAYTWLPRHILDRYARCYGTRTEDVLAGATSMADLGDDLGGGLHEAEADYLVRREWARTAEDILWRRTKIGLHVDREAVRRLEEWLRTHTAE